MDNSRNETYDKVLPKNSICAEIGVQDGINVERILNISKPKKLYLIDLWNYDNLRNVPDEKREILSHASEISYQEVKKKFKNNKKIIH